ncbi:MAG: glycoside hydrolase family 9 protein [Chitinispirillia bacterium]|nr:glycoside hydrolase family 9 protein [Chitinispirillia bacterium]MCL2268832.1 glycoside hydrolase family 9 protein [Chitinispirillia bacterium]
MIRRIVVIAAVFCMLAGPVAAIAQTAAAGKFSAEQYKKALWMVTRFYGAQRSGHGPNWLLMDHTHKVSFVKDSDGSHDLVGGWFDCGDHVLFGQTFFYSAYMLALAYEMFPKGFHDLYHGEDYSDYADSKDWSMAGGKPDGVPDLLQELKYATDWIIKAAPNGTTFYYEKGHGGKDHRNWVTAGFMSTLAREEGGERDGPRDIFKNPNDGVMASFAAATLAIMSKIYRKYDPAYADLCLVHAKNAYTYASGKKNNSAGAASGSYYGAHKDPATVFVTAASEMYMATGDNTYLNAIDHGQVKGSYWVLDYANTHDLAAYAAARADQSKRADHLKLMLDEFVSKYASQVNSEKVSTMGGDWGQLRYAGNTAFAAALYSLAMNTNEYDQFIYDQIDYILGANNAKQSFIVGYCEGCTKVASKPHHRNVYLSDDNDEGNHLVIPERNRYFGYLVGGQRNSASYVDDIKSYTNTEGGIDYNAGLLGALGYIVSKMAPADTSKFGVDEPPPPPPAVPATLRISTSINAGDTSAFVKDTLFMSAQSESVTLLYAYIFDEYGNIMDIPCDSVYWAYSNGGAVPIPPGCIFPLGSGFSGDPAVISASYRLGGAIRDSVVIAAEEVSVRHRVSTMAKNGYSITVRPNAVLFAVPDGRSIAKVSVHDLRGRRVFNRTGGESRITWNSGRHSKGMYVVRMVMDNGVVVQRNLMLK